MNAIESAVSAALGLFNSQPLVVAWSGGLDSTVLVHVCLQLGLKIQPVHVNHGLQKAAFDFEHTCHRQAQEWGLPFVSLQLPQFNGAGSLETWAREERYRAIANWMAGRSLTHLVLAHHSGDQAETILMQLFRGSGLRGVGGMAAVGQMGVAQSDFPGLQLHRPLLDFSKASLRQYANDHQLSWIEDPSNARSDCRRNWVRCELIPQIRKQYPQVEAGVLALGRFVQNHHDTVDSLSRDLLVFVTQGSVLLLGTWRKQSELTQLELLRLWLLNGGVRCGREKLFELRVQLNKPTGGLKQVAGDWQVRVQQGKASLIRINNDE